MNPTVDPTLRSWLENANLPGSDFPIQNLPIGSFRRRGSNEPFRGGIAIGDQIVDLSRVQALGGLRGLAAEACAAAAQSSLNGYLALGAPAWSALRAELSLAMQVGASAQSGFAACLVPQQDAEHALPMVVGDYTDFYASIHHATRVGALFRPEQPLFPNYKWVPIAYHGRSSSVVVSDTPIVRPRGQTVARGGGEPSVRASARLDYEAELGIVVGPGNALGRAIPIDHADGHVYGLCLLNDWSARDVQGWEYQPLGPFAGKNFATTLSPWLVSLEALEPFRLPFTRAQGEPEPLPHLDSVRVRTQGALDVQIEVRIQTAAMRAHGQPPERLSRSSFRHAYWTLAQLVAHHTLNGCPLRPGDVLGSGTLSGPALEESGCMLELSEGGKRPLTLASGETRTFLEDGDAIELSAFCERDGAVRIGFGVARGVVVAANL
ncbi:MAG TPA: fumarylacetoacetase [Polyangiales bacterium]